MRNRALVVWIFVLVAMTLLAGCGAAKDGTNITISDIGNVEGTVTDSSSSAALSSVTVQIGDKSATTNSSGVYSVTDLAVGSRTITATKTGYQSYNGTVTVTKGTTITQNIQMTLTGASDSTPPTVLSTNPADNATGVAITQALTVTFSETMDCSTVTTSSFTLKDNLNAAIAGTISSCNSTTAVFTPSSNLSYSVPYTATITTEVKDLAGNAMVSNHPWNFTIASASSGSTIIVNPSAISESISADTTHNLTVTVLDADGKPLNGADVFISGAFAAPRSNARYQFYRAPLGTDPVNSGFTGKTDAFGNYYFSIIVPATVGGLANTFLDTIEISSGVAFASVSLTVQ